MTILGIDTSNQGMVLGLGEENQLLGSYMTANQKNHSTTLMPGIDFLMSSNGKQPKDLSKVIVAEGPGSYTGLRIGVTTAKTLAWTLETELYAVSSLAVIAASQKEWTGLIVPVINARRNNVYTAAYQWEVDQLVTVIEDQHTSFTEWLLMLQTLEEPILFTGIDVLLFKEEIEQAASSLFSYQESPLNNLLKGEAFFRLENQSRKVTDIEGFIPKYLKKVEAEEKWLETHQRDEGVSYVERV